MPGFDASEVQLIGAIEKHGDIAADQLVDQMVRATDHMAESESEAISPSDFRSEMNGVVDNPNTDENEVTEAAVAHGGVNLGGRTVLLGTAAANAAIELFKGKVQDTITQLTSGGTLQRTLRQIVSRESRQ